MNSHLKNQAYNIPFVRRESFLGHSLEQLDFALVLEVSSILSSHVSMQYKFYYLFECKLLPFIFNLSSK